MNFSDFFKKTDFFLKKGLIFFARCDIISMLTEDGLLVKWLRLRPLTAATGVRLPYRSPSNNALLSLTKVRFFNIIIRRMKKW